MKYTLSTPLEQCIRTTAKYLKELEKIDISTLGDFLNYLPRSYEDRSVITDVSEIRADKKNILVGELKNIRKEKTPNGHILVKALFIDQKSRSQLECVWFSQPHLEKTLPRNSVVMLVGKAKLGYGKISLQNPSVEIYEKNRTLGDIFPIYPEHLFISSGWFSKKFQESIIPLLESKKISIPETLPKKILEEKQFFSELQSLLALHAPKNMAEVEKARKKFSFTELFLLQTSSILSKKSIQKKKGKNQHISVPFEPEIMKKFFQTFPFSPTNAQKISIFEILKDMEKPISMQRLLEGDVGAGKTFVALCGCVAALKKNLQCAIIAPTEILASQHFKGITKDLERAAEKGFFNSWYSAPEKAPILEKNSTPSPTLSQEDNQELFPEQKTSPCVEFLSGSVKGKKREKILENLRYGKIDILIGTHALLEDPVVFKNLGVVVVDEQHRFGVMQREKLLQKSNPHFLQMSATPIPRTLAIVAFGDMDISVLTELPPGRKPIETKVVPHTQRRTVELFIDDQIEKGRQAFIICPLVEDSEHFDELKSATQEFMRLDEHIFPRRKVALLHGKMKPSEKDKIMNDFKDKKYDILVSTSVIEVGVDVPNATIMCIEGAERFGLSQLHQFRGRVGRGEHQSYCFLFSTKNTENARLRALEQTENGFELAEIDMHLRGPGEVYGVRQSGIGDMKAVNLMDGRLVVEAREYAERFLETQNLENYPSLEKEIKKRQKRILKQ